MIRAFLADLLGLACLIGWGVTLLILAAGFQP